LLTESLSKKPELSEGKLRGPIGNQEQLHLSGKSSKRENHEEMLMGKMFGETPAKVRMQKKFRKEG